MPPPPKNSFIEELLPRCYFFKTGSEGFRQVGTLNTYFFVAKRDLAGSDRRRNWLVIKIKDAIQYPIEGEDWQVLEKISTMRPADHHFKTYLVWSLYLYLAGLVSAYENTSGEHSKHVTFLEACRKSGFLDEYDRRPMEEKFTQALKLLGLWEMRDPASGHLFIQNLLQEWKIHGTFKVNGLPSQTEVQSYEFAGKPHKSGGDFYNLTTILCEPESPKMKTDNCISFLLGVKDKLNPAASPKEKERQILDICRAASTNKTLASELVRKGDETRFERSLKAAEAAFAGENIHDLTEEEIHQSHEYFREFLGKLPLATRKILYYTNQSIAHTEDGDLRNILPKGAIYGATEEESNKSRESQGAYDERFKILFAANGFHLTNATDRNLQLRKKVLTTIHESLHIAFGRDGANTLDHNDFADLKSEIGRLGIDVYAACYNLLRKPPASLNGKSPLLNETYLDMLNPESKFYEGYNSNRLATKILRQPQEEILANLLALSIAEPKCPIFDKSIPELAQVQELVTNLQRVYTQVADRLEERAQKIGRDQSLQ